MSFHHGGGVGMGYSLHAGQVIVADGTEEAARRIERTLTSDPAMGVFRHVDAGYDRSVVYCDSRTCLKDSVTWMRVMTGLLKLPGVRCDRVNRILDQIGKRQVE